MSDRLYATITPAYADVPIGETVVLQLSIGNTSGVIDGYTVRVFGLDVEWVAMEPERLSLFPGDTGTIAILLRLPDGFPAGQRQVSVHVQSENDPTVFELPSVTLNVGSRPRLTVAVDPTMVTGGSTAQFGLVVSNLGNSIVDVTPEAIDPEDQAEFRFVPGSTHLLPGEQAVFQATVRAPRPWIGQPTLRVLTFGARSTDKVETMATFVQRPRIGRWVLSLLGLVTAAAVFAAVLSRTLSGVVDEAKVSDEVVNQALADGEDDGEKVPVNPASVTGKVVSASTGSGIAGVQAELFRADDTTLAISSAATSDDGSFAFGRLGGGDYLVKFSGAGFSDAWYPAAAKLADAEPVTVPPGEPKELKDVVLGGRPGSVSGKVIAPDVTGATVRLVVPGLADATTPAVVAEVDVSADGSFTLEDVPTPATYQLVVERPGNATATQQVLMEPAQAVEGLEIRLGGGDGVITGHISAGGQRLGGVTIDATDGTTELSMVSLTEDDIGAFTVRGLATPGRYTVTFSREGYATESRSVSLAQGESVTLDVNLTAAVGSISGTVNAATGGPLGGVSVTVTGGEEPVVTSTISQGEAAGTWSVDALTAPGSYTVTFAKAGYVSQTRLVTIDGTAAGGTTAGIDAALVASTATVTGLVLDAGGAPKPLAGVELTDGVTTRTVKSANDPAGRFALTAVPPGSYTLTVSFTGATPVVQVITVQAGDTRDLQLQLGQQATLTGRVVTTDGQPVAGIEVRLYDPTSFPSTNTNVPKVVTGADGTYSFMDIAAPADFVLAAFSSGTAVDALDSELVASVPGEAITVADLRVTLAENAPAPTTVQPATVTPPPTSVNPNETMPA
jgi:5-hydroxyisourate hydrolase-like protein (transthyretin family)